MKKKTLMSLAAAAVMTISSVGIAAHGEAGLFTIGDLNGDGMVDATDASSVLAAYACASTEKESPLLSSQLPAADLNGDGMIDAVDASLILSYYAWASSSNDEGAILTDFLEKNGFKQKMTDADKAERTKENNGGEPAPEQNDAPPIAEPGSFEYTLPRIDSEYDEWFWVGDSRTVGMARGIDIDYIGKVGAGISLFRNNYDQICQIRDKTVIINLGVNDLDSGAYLRLYNGLPDDFLENNKVIVLAVNPCDGNYQYLNSRIEKFNSDMSAGLDSRITFLDSYTFLVWNGFATVDGLHYTNNTYVDIYNFVFDSLHAE
ncbi:dockerin type I domain-containing protein [Ruminococcus flavefaciens]|uniref:dockerin type I domain-containing protein n=1 Tax=Ruminococcus flavefaciens TaxID=1265 RepID=UPI0002EC5885|nr:dockerin type I domain-containing protein [Ruminococcus flavefaciens]